MIFPADRQAQGLALLAERAALIARTDAFDRRWWGVGKACRYVSSALAIASLALFAGTAFCDWSSWWLAWSALIAGQAFGWGHSWAARATIKRRLAATYELCAINDRMRASADGLVEQIAKDPL